MMAATSPRKSLSMRPAWVVIPLVARPLRLISSMKWLGGMARRRLSGTRAVPALGTLMDRAALTS